VNEYQERNEILRQIGFASYADYLASDLWDGIRYRVLVAARRTCCACGGEASQVHHSRYTEGNLRGRNREDLHAVCRTCHEKAELDSGGNAANSALGKPGWHPGMGFAPVVTPSAKAMRGAGRA
jgi:hypothetical protein